jgi:hypothetical protein
MGNAIVAQFGEALRLSTLGTTVCSRTENRPPEFIDISQFPGVARALVFFDGVPNGANQIAILKKYNVESVEYAGPGQYKIIFKTGTFKDQFIAYSGTLTQRVLTAANSFYGIFGSGDPSLSSVRIQTINTVTQNQSQTAVNCNFASIIFYQA